nr:hypothetical protein [Tanacetum cinerariifolium]
STSTGSLNTSLPVATTSGHKEVMTTLGQGGALLKASTVNGSIEFKPEGKALPQATSDGRAAEIEGLKKVLPHASPDALETVLAQARSAAYVPVQIVVLNVPVLPTVPGVVLGRLGLSRIIQADKWLDTLLAGRHSSSQVVRQLAARRQLRDKSQALSTAFAKEGDYAKAYQYFLQYTAYKDSLTAEATTRRLAALEYRQNLLKKETQI